MPDTSPTSLETLARALVGIAREASAVVMEVYAGAFTVATKEDASPVTLADERAEVLILDRLGRLAPGVGIISEEAFSCGHSGAVGSTFFLVDPLDGTREFVNRNGEFTVNIALVEDGAPVAGVIAAPSVERLFVGWRDGGAFEVTPADTFRPIAARSRPDTGVIAVASRSHRDAETDVYLTHLGISDMRASGSSLKFCLLAAGEADIYPRFGPTMEWDTAAGHAILAAAGGAVSGLDGSPFAYGKTDAGFRNPGFLAWGRGPRPPLPGPA